MSVRRGSVYSASRIQKLKTMTSTEAEIVTANDIMPQIFGPGVFCSLKVSKSHTMSYSRITKVQYCCKPTVWALVQNAQAT
jgi:hypothetical protein